jgi:hypothetical protein
VTTSVRVFSDDRQAREDDSSILGGFCNQRDNHMLKLDDIL